VNDGSANVWFATMAIALAVMAIIQVALVIVAIRLALQAVKAVQEIRRELTPLVAKINRVADDAARVSALALTQVERIDQMFGAASEGVENIVGLVQDSVMGPLRKGSAIVSAIRAGFAFFRGFQGKTRPVREDDDALFVG
jgi:type IV secretory pathway VirB2 component (pilin)